MFLRTTFFDTAVTLLCFLAAGIVSGYVLHDGSRTLTMLVALGIGLTAFLAVAPLLYRVFRKRPMHFPVCPHCGSGAGPWGLSPGSKPIGTETMTCGQCGEMTAFVYARSSDNGAAPALPAYVLKWPRPLGRWQRVR